MGTFSHSITLYDSSGQRSETIEAVVDTGATFSLIPASILERLGVAPHRHVRFRQASGQIIESPMGGVRAQLNGMQEEILCLFGRPNDPPVIGAHTLEGFLLAVDPVAQRLVPVEGLQL